MKYKHKEYGLGIKISDGIANIKYPFLNRDRYKGKGRPKKEHYDYITLTKIVARITRAHNNMLLGDILLGQTHRPNENL